MPILANDFDRRDEVFHAASMRQDVVMQTQVDLYQAARSLGQTHQQAIDKLQDLFNAYPGEWAAYVVAGADGIVTAIQNDATLPWLDTDVAGLTIRQRLINRLS